MCDTWVALRDTTSSKQVIFAKNSDRPMFDCQPLMHYTAQQWSKDSTIQLEYIEIPQVQQTYATLGSSPYWCWGYEEGINEHGVVIGNEAIFTRTFRQAAQAYRAGNTPDLGVLGMDLIRLALERSRNAAQAVEIIGQLVEQYGQFGSGVPAQPHDKGGYDNSFIVADSDEAWVIETVGKRWVAKQFTKGATSISNQPTIRQTWDAGSDDIESYAQQQGWWSQAVPFDFAHAYIDDKTSRQVSHIRVMRSRQLLAQRAGEITLPWMMRIARDHYEDTFLNGAFFDVADPDFLSICMHVSPSDFTWGNTASSCVVTLPTSSDSLPVFWWTPCPPCNGCYIPFFVHGSQLPEIVSTAGTFGKRVSPPSETVPDEFAPDSYWWLFRKLLDTVKGDAVKSVPGLYQVRHPIVRERFDTLEAEFKAQVPDIITQAVDNGNVNPTILDNFTAACVERVIAEIQSLMNDFTDEVIAVE